VAFINYYPAIYLLGKQNAIWGGAVLSWCSPLVAGLLLALAFYIWSRALRVYSSTGS
jgi:ABC-2 type transport system permease protein